MIEKNIKLGIVGLGYVGLPLAIEFGKKIQTIGFDINDKRIQNLKKDLDLTLEVESKEFELSTYLNFTSDINDLRECNYYIVTVPTPINKNYEPDLSFLESASKMLGTIIKKNDIIIYESTVFPGATEEICCPILEQESKLKFNTDFFCGYSPERINPGDKVHRIADIVKVTSGSTVKTAEKIDNLYSLVALSGTHRAESIKVAEAAKVIENIQRDVNIALVNELSVVFNKLNINTKEVLKAARTKWNFLDFRPGLVGGHCIGIDPYYLTYKSREVGYDPQIILAGRKLNESMYSFIGDSVVNAMIENNISLSRPKLLILGLTFKENCPDLRNSKVFDLIKFFEQKNFDIDVYDPWITDASSNELVNINLISEINTNQYDTAIIAVAHNCYQDMLNKNIKSYVKKNHVIYDMKHFLDPNLVTSSI